MDISRSVGSRIAGAAIAAVLAVPVLLATAVPAAAAVNCTTSHCATVQIVFATNLGNVGKGVVTSGDGVLNCADNYGSASGICSDKVSWPLGSPSTTITLTGTPSAGTRACYSADGLNDACSPVGQTYVLQKVLLPNGTPSVIFFFDVTQDTLIVQTIGTGTGDVYYNSTVVSCSGGGCGSDYNYGTVIQLTAKASTGSFAGWGRDCAGQGPTCTLTMDTTHRVTAAFNLAVASPTANPAATPTRGGSSKSTPAPGQSAALGSPGESVLGATDVPSGSDGTSGSGAPTPSGSPDPAETTTPVTSDGPPWAPIILIIVLVLIGINLMIFQVVRSRRPGP